jgi:hypothetical protein
VPFALMVISSLNAIEFSRHFSDRGSCLSCLASMKWKDGYACRKCECRQYTKGILYMPAVAGNAAMTKALAAYTIFHNLKFDLLKAFYAAFRYCKKKAPITFGCFDADFFESFALLISIEFKKFPIEFKFISIVFKK